MKSCQWIQLLSLSGESSERQERSLRTELTKESQQLVSVRSALLSA